MAAGVRTDRQATMNETKLAALIECSTGTAGSRTARPVVWADRGREVRLRPDLLLLRHSLRPCKLEMQELSGRHRFHHAACDGCSRYRSR
jgi:hypothetical protein